ncbi:oxidoreductase-like protein [Phascolomyces articulosus]|uniref:Oxidoreductase-like protein n=1 Tax=Phascolomyces articulosus TaxID=60185 RepID=A0AAD5PCT7_9FUNG|nr:oxidoreductase-like protein [Phascolomyces articulosus]
MPFLLKPLASRHLVNSVINRSKHTRASNYDGWWTLVLQQPDQEPNVAFTSKAPIAVPTMDTTSQPSVSSKYESGPKEFVTLKGEKIQLPQKPVAPDDCCMSGCAYCVWDIYQEDMEEYQAEKAELRQRFNDAGEQLPSSLAASKKSIQDQIQDEMDPTMKAFYAMEKKMKGN